MIQAVGTSGVAMSTMQRAGPPPPPKEVFSKVDSDQSGTLNLDELQAMLDQLAEKMGGSVPSAEEMMDKLDTDGDGELSTAELEAGRPEGGPQGPPPGPPPNAAQGTVQATSASDVVNAGLLAYLSDDGSRNTSILNIKV